MKTTNKIVLRTKNVSNFPGLNVYFISEVNQMQEWLHIFY